MAQTNTKKAAIFTHEGGKAKNINPEQQLRRSIMSCLLWESEFYEDGQSIADRIKSVIPRVNPNKLCDIAIEAREQMKLRHVPLLVAREMARLGNKETAKTLANIIQRPDEITEFISIYWMGGKEPLSKQVKKGLGLAFNKFNEYQLAKYNRKGAVKLRDALRLVHPVPVSEHQSGLFKKIAEDTLATPDTWEVALSGGADKAETFTRLINEGKLGGLAMLRNIRNMQKSGVDTHVIRKGIAEINASRILPFRFIAAARYAPQLEPEIEHKMLESCAELPRFNGNTIILVDVSYSMLASLSKKSDMMRIEAACGLAVIMREICSECLVYSFSSHVLSVPARRGFALRDAIVNSQDWSGTFLGEAIEAIYKNNSPERLIVITDEQTADPIPNPIGKGYLINVASAKNGVGYGPWTHIDGFSENVVRYISELENNND